MRENTLRYNEKYPRAIIYGEIVMFGSTSLKHTTSLKIITPNYNAQDYVVSSKWRKDNVYLRNQSHVVSTIYSEYGVNGKLIILLSKSFILENNIVCTEKSTDVRRGIRWILGFL